MNNKEIRSEFDTNWSSLNALISPNLLGHDGVVGEQIKAWITEKLSQERLAVIEEIEKAVNFLRGVPFVDFARGDTGIHVDLGEALAILDSMKNK